ncbi:Alpha-D-glucose-1-phosphate phosphatase YihX [Planctomycetes bacterium MalM25]|nr:Alpha-D-glucose-1-phosphate phosphatase YihX [Planctomycetes bacterium MalM25]
MSQPPEFLYFDLGKVLLDFDHARMVRQMAGVAGVSEEAMRAALMPSGDPTEGDQQWALEAGQLSEDAYYEGLCERLGVRPPRAEFELAASDIFTPIQASLDLVTRLHAAGHRMGILSNTNSIHWRFFLDGRYPELIDAFEIKLGSFEVGSMKPDPVIYLSAIELAGVPAERVFFTDDKPENIAGAMAVGIDAVPFTDTASLVDELNQRGVPC